jgi:hypothetical protein
MAVPDVLVAATWEKRGFCCLAKCSVVFFGPVGKRGGIQSMRDYKGKYTSNSRMVNRYVPKITKLLQQPEP